MGYLDPVVGGTALRRAAIQSPGFVAGSTGWSINIDGSAEFDDLTFRGTFNGTDFEVTKDGAFFYSGAPAAGNLIMSLSTVSGTDAKGNAYIGPGMATYDQSGPFMATVVQGSSITWYTAASSAGPWTAGGGTIFIGDAFGPLKISPAGGQTEITGSLTLDDGTLTLGEFLTGTPPTPSGAGVLYVDTSGNLRYLGPSGTNTKLANA
jgi:hypothetical protein